METISPFIADGFHLFDFVSFVVNVALPPSSFFSMDFQNNSITVKGRQSSQAELFA